jgi:hypothetical protein
MDMSVRDKLNEGKLGVGVTIAFLAIAGSVLAYMLWPAHHIDPTSAYYSDDDGQSYFKDSAYKFPPFDHDGKTAVQAMVFLDHGSKIVGYLIRYTPEAHKKLTDMYNGDLEKNLSSKDIQHDVLTYMHNPDIFSRGQECKLPGPDNKWMARASFITTMIKTPSGDPPEGVVLP